MQWTVSTLEGCKESCISMIARGEVLGSGLPCKAIEWSPVADVCLVFGLSKESPNYQQPCQDNPSTTIYSLINGTFLFPFLPLY